MAKTTFERLDFNNKQENNGADNRGRLTAHEFNRAIDTINDHSDTIEALAKQLAGYTINIQNSEADFEKLENKDANTIYFIFEG